MKTYTVLPCTATTIIITTVLLLALNLVPMLVLAFCNVYNNYYYFTKTFTMISCSKVWCVTYTWSCMGYWSVRWIFIINTNNEWFVSLLHDDGQSSTIIHAKPASPFHSWSSNASICGLRMAKDMHPGLYPSHHFIVESAIYTCKLLHHVHCHWELI